LNYASTQFDLAQNRIWHPTQGEGYLAQQITIKLLNAKYNVQGWCSGKVLMIRVATVSWSLIEMVDTCEGDGHVGDHLTGQGCRIL
jgi:hypothetical protein